jgi:DNA-binding response OmpR family regulator
MPKLLVIDDDQGTCEYIKEFFELRKYVVLTADSGQKGLAIIKEQKPDLTLLDVNMEVMDGLEVLKKIKQYDPGAKVIMVTVASDDDTRQMAAKLGADDFIRKPIHRDYLEGTVLLKVSALVRERKRKNADAKDSDSR